MKTNEEAQDFIRTWLAEHKQRVIDLFKDWDEDGNGTIDLKEFRHGLAALGIRMRSDKVESLFETLDKDGSGEIDYNELTVGLQNKKTLKDMPQGPRHFALPPLHERSRESIANADPYDCIYINSPDHPDGLPLTLLPRHCEQFTWGSRLHDQLMCDKNDAIVLMGAAPPESGQATFSAFRNIPNAPEGDDALVHFLRSQGITHLYVCGLALDYCVTHTALDAASAGFVVTVIEDSCRGTSTLEMRRKLQLLDQANVQRITAKDLADHQQHCTLDDTELALQMAPKAKELVDQLFMRPAYAKIAEPNELTKKLAHGSEAAYDELGGKQVEKLGLLVEARVAELKRRQTEGNITDQEQKELSELHEQLTQIARATELRRRGQVGKLTPDEEIELHRIEKEIGLAKLHQNAKADETLNEEDMELYSQLRQRQAEGTLTPEELAELQELEQRLAKDHDSSAPPSSAATTQPSRLGTAERAFRYFDKDGDGLID